MKPSGAVLVVGVGLSMLSGCADVGSNTVVYLTRDGDTQSLGPACVLVQESPGESSGDSEPLTPADDRGFASAIRTSDGVIEYAYFVDGTRLLEMQFTVDDLQTHEVVRRTFEDGDDEYEVVFWSSPDCESDTKIPRPH